jgi:hypothetical protein
LDRQFRRVLAILVGRNYVREEKVTKLMLAVLAAAALTVGCGSSATTDSADPAGAAAEEGGVAGAARKAAAAVPTYREVTLPAGTALPLELKTAVASDTSQVEDTVRATLRRAITIDGAQVLPAGTEVVGAVTNAERSARVKGRAKIAFRFTSLQHAGDRYDIRTEAISRTAAATKSEDATKIAVGAGAGAAVGALLGGGSGAAKGAAIGGAGGTGVVLATRGKEVRLGPGADVNTKLTSPLTIRVKVG